MNDVNWQEIKTAYLCGAYPSVRKLAETYGVKYTTLAARAHREGWSAEKRRLRGDGEKTQEQRLARVQYITDLLLNKLEKAVEELDVRLLKRERKVKQIEYGNELRPDKPTRETVVDDEELIRQSATVDVAEVKQIASALREIKEVQMLQSVLDAREQEARIARLERELSGADDGGVEIVLSAEAEEFAK